MHSALYISLCLYCIMYIPYLYCRCVESERRTKEITKAEEEKRKTASTLEEVKQKTIDAKVAKLKLAENPDAAELAKLQCVTLLAGIPDTKLILIAKIIHVKELIPRQETGYEG